MKCNFSMINAGVISINIIKLNDLVIINWILLINMKKRGGKAQGRRRPKALADEVIREEE